MRFVPLSEAIGAEIQNLDLTRPIGEADAEALRAALDEYQLLVIRGQHGLADQQHIAFAEVFGPVADQHLDGERLSWVSNIRDGKGAARGSSRLFFHSDLSFTRWPLSNLSLQAIEISGNVAPTRFASARRAWQALDPEMQSDLAPRRALHMANFSGAAPDYRLQSMASFDDLDPLLYPHTWHRIMRPHPRTGSPLLFVNEYLTMKIDGLEPQVSRARLDEVFAVLYDDKYVYDHVWHEGDLIIWDNLALQHGRQAFDPVPGMPPPIRTLRRVAASEHYLEMLDSVPRLKAALTSHMKIGSFVD